MIRIVTDSGSDITQSEAKEYGITVLPLKISFNGEDFLDGVTIDHTSFYNRLIESDQLPVTSLVGPYQYEEAFDKYKDDEIICITVSGKLSGCYQSAMIARKDNVILVDSESATIGQRILIEYGLKLIKDGYSAKQIGQILEEKKKQIRVLALLDTLEYLKKGGRISTATAIVGTLLTIKPVVTLNEGVIVQLGKARGSKSGCNFLREKIAEDGSINFEEPFALAYSGLESSLLYKYIEDSKDLYANYNGDLPVYVIGAAIGTHVGPGTIGIAYFKK